MILRTLIGAGLVGVFASSVWAQDAALVIGNRDYDDGGSVADADSVFDAIFGLRAAGFQISSGRDADQDRVADLVDAFVADSEDADRVVIMLAGHFVEGRRDTYFLPTDANTATATRLRRSSLDLTTVMDVAASKPGGAIVVLTYDPSSSYDLGGSLILGLGDLEIPQGVTLVTGAPQAATTFVEELIDQPGLTLAEAAAAAPGGVTIQGYQTNLHGFLDGEAMAQSPDELREEGWWAAARSFNTVEAAQAYLNTYPDGAFESEARALIDDLREAPRREAQAAEQAMSLSRNDRRALQRMLTLLGHNTRGIDGIFGRGTRSAITEWQSANDIEPTGYFTRAAVRKLERQAAARTAELEAEAAEQARIEERRENAMWGRVTRRDTVEAYRNYLERYPDGTYVENATGRLRQLDRAARRNARAEERGLWDEVTVDGSAEAFRQYLSRYPDGVFADDATAQLRALEEAEAGQAAQAAAEAEENQVIGNPIMRLLTERRLDGLGLEPGAVDGRFDDATRRAIRQYQRARGLPVTGYVSQQTAVRMLAEAVR